MKFDSPPRICFVGDMAIGSVMPYVGNARHRNGGELSPESDANFQPMPVARIACVGRP